MMSATMSAGKNGWVCVWGSCFLCYIIYAYWCQTQVPYQMMFVCRLTFTHWEPLYNAIGAKTVYSSRACCSIFRFLCSVLSTTLSVIDLLFFFWSLYCLS